LEPNVVILFLALEIALSPEGLITERYGLALRIVQFEKDLEEPAQVGLEQ
jgi:hypothetical protein